MVRVHSPIHISQAHGVFIGKTSIFFTRLELNIFGQRLLPLPQLHMTSLLLPSLKGMESV